MSRIPTHTFESVSEAARPYLRAAASDTPRVLNLHAQMSHSPAVIASYMGMRRALAEHATFDPKVRAAIMLTVSGMDRCAYSLAVNAALARRAGWTEDQIASIAAGTYAEDKLGALLRVAREATGNTGRVGESTWKAALAAQWTDADLAETFAFVGIMLYVNFFVHFGETEVDVAGSVDRT